MTAVAEPAYVHPSKRVRTERRGVYRRGFGYSVGWRDENGKQRWKELRSFDDAIAFKALRDAERQGVLRELLASKRATKVRERADLTDVYESVLRALKALDKTDLGTTLANPIFSALYKAEDAAADAIKRSY